MEYEKLYNDMLKDSKVFEACTRNEVGKVWGNIIDYMDFFKCIFDVALNTINNEIKDLSMSESEKIVLITGLNRLSIMTREIIVLARNGCPEGAHSRWRDLYEQATIITYIFKHAETDKTCERYLKHQEKIDKNRLYQYCKNVEGGQSELEDLKIKSSELEKYVNLRLKDYDWAGKNNTFAKIQRSLDCIGDMNIYYNFANSSVHSGGIKSLSAIITNLNIKNNYKLCYQGIDLSISLTCSILIWCLKNIYQYLYNYNIDIIIQVNLLDDIYNTKIVEKLKAMYATQSM